MTHPYSTISDAQLAEAKRLYLDDLLSTYRVAARLKVSQEAVRAALRRAGVALRFGAAAQTMSRSQRSTVVSKEMT